MWTMGDYLGYNYVNKYNVQGYHACPLCGPELQACYIPHLKKMVYEGHTKYLPMDHHLRGRYQREIPKTMTVADWKTAWDDNDDGASLAGIKGVNIFYTLPYWGELLIHHLLDPMHCFKNVAVAIWQHICGHKDSYNSRADQKEVNIMRQCWP